jgi:hypothetical protein
MRKLCMMAFATLALLVTAPTTASAANAIALTATSQPAAAPKATGSTFDNCYCTYRVRYYRTYRYTYRVRYNHVRYTYRYRVTYVW